jgi:hypothetical protein
MVNCLMQIMLSVELFEFVIIVVSIFAVVAISFFNSRNDANPSESRRHIGIPNDPEQLRARFEFLRQMIGQYEWGKVRSPQKSNESNLDSNLFVSDSKNEIFLASNDEEGFLVDEFGLVCNALGLDDNWVVRHVHKQNVSSLLLKT